MCKPYLGVGFLLLMASCAQEPHRSVVAQQISAPALMKPNECIASSSAAMTFQPSFKSVQNAMDGLQATTEIPTPTNKYRAYAKIFVMIDSSGLVEDARIPLAMRGAGGKFVPVEGGYASTGNREVDKAILAWARDVRFNPVQCTFGKYRFASIQIDLQ
jgi:hypothetical protein